MKAIALLLLCTVLLSGCSALFAEPAAASPTPTATPTLQPTNEPTPTPNIPPVDETLPDIQVLSTLPVANWPDTIRMPYQHSSGFIAQAQASLYKDGFAIFLMENTGEVVADSFLVEDLENDVHRIRPVALGDNPYDSGEGLFLKNITGKDPDTVLADTVNAHVKDGFTLLSQEDMAYWNQLYDAQSTLFGALPYAGRFSVLQHDNTMLRIFCVNTETQDYLITMRIEERVSQPPMFYLLCATLSTFRVIG